MESVASVVAEAGGQWTDAASKQLVQIAQQKNLIANYKNMGYSVEQVTTALTRQGPVRDSIIGQLDAAIDRVRTENTVMTENGPIVTARGRELADYYQQQNRADLRFDPNEMLIEGGTTERDGAPAPTYHFADAKAMRPYIE